MSGRCGFPAAILAIAASLAAAPAGALEPIDEIELWDNATGPHLRGSTISQRRFYPESDDRALLGPGPSGPPHSQRDLDQLAALGANVVMISHPGPFAETPPYALEPDMERSLDHLVAMAARADLFVVLTFRTGPGRSEFGFFAEEAGTWFEAGQVDDSLWASRPAQDAWVAMWRHVARRYRDHPAVVGYELMVEPNANKVGHHAIDHRLDIDDPAAFHRRYGGSLYDWNQLHPRITAAIREVDPETPVLVPGNGHASIDFLPWVAVTEAERQVYVVHNYEPFLYTFQGIGDGRRWGGRFDLDWDGAPELADRSVLERAYVPVDTFRRDHGRPVAVTEFGLVRWAPGGAAYLGDHLAAMEARGFNHLFYFWDPSFPAYRQMLNPFNFRFGPNPDNRRPIADNPLVEAVAPYWALNRLRPSNVRLRREAGE